ncbi:helix-turn-helix domain containing protein [Streptomyces noursei]|uniref:hypothetical protein n=1 Tax=Streptomyces noursei TaxID=1971 RepID=UPI00081CA661|nr:hypothetical protein SNOUR_00565 [Streptomyces noursei ATCC 11455]ANZ21899.1 hypothetical protein SNOUR_43385 [Streptomyces noursei ATCC 11455]MCZ0996498.1 helix-turn-helix domain containing protein [Streptomyces noursei]
MSPRQNEAARLTQQLIDAGLTRKQVADLLDRDASLVSQFFTKGKGAAFIPALQHVVRAVGAGERDRDALRRVAQEHVTRRLTSTGARARVRGKDIVGTVGRSAAGRAGQQAIAHGAAHLAKVVHAAGRAGGRLAFTIRMEGDQYVYHPGSEDDSPGLKRGVVPRTDGTQERSYGSAKTGGFDAAEWSRRVADHYGDVTAAVQAWLVETGRAVPQARLQFLEVRTWLPRR